MVVCGIIAEYDPFHTGHQWQISEIRRQLGLDCAVLVILSGNWSQRGTPSMLEKHDRARMALQGGADLVLELPLPWATASAEGFARGGISLLMSTGVVTHLCFGSEEGTLTPLQEAAECLDNPDYPTALRSGLAAGLSFPAARQQALENLLKKDMSFLTQPNNNLGVEYLRAASGSGIIPITVCRQGAGHNEAPTDGFASAGYLRSLFRQGNRELAVSYLIPGALQNIGPMADLTLGERAALDRLRRLTRTELAELPDCGGGLSNRLYQAIHRGGNLADILERAKTKRYPLSRLRRVLMYGWLGLRAKDRPENPLYIRVLGLNETGQSLLHQMKSLAKLPLITKPTAVRNMSPQIQSLFQLEAQATDCRELCLLHPGPCGQEWQHSPVVFPACSNR